MPKCKVCGKQVLAGRVFHSACWAQQVTKNITEEFCDNYCRYPHERHSDASLAEHCDNCVLIKLLNAGL